MSIHSFDPNRPRRQPIGPQGRARKEQTRRLHNQADRSANDRRQKKRSVESELLTEATGLPAPSWMNKEQKRIFDNVMEIVLRTNTAQVTDKFLLLSLCIQFTQYLDVCETIALDGSIVSVEGSDNKVYRKAHPLLAERGRLFSSVRSLCAEFGLSPKHRSKIIEEAVEDSPVIDPEEEEWDEILG